MTDNNQIRQQQILRELATLRDKNLAFFAEEYPSLYQVLAPMALTNLRLNVLPDSDEMELYENERPIYDGKAKQVAKAEVDEFCRIFKEGELINSVPTYDASCFNINRFFFEKAHKVVQFDEFERAYYKGYRLGSFYPLVIFTGIGLGYHIDEFIRHNQVNHVIVADYNIEKLLASLFCVDWEAMSDGFVASEGKSFNFVLTMGKGPSFHRALWNKMLELIPVFPAATLFFNHMGDEFNREVIDTINGDIVQVPSGWGNYDDEVNQINNAIHNLYQGIGGLPLFTEAIRGNVVVVGSGPSLNNNIKHIKTIREHVTLISCGTALRVLYTHGIKPDIHVEIESDAVTEKAVSYIGDLEWVKSIAMVGLLQVNPLVYKLFDDKRFVLKYPSSSGTLFKDVAPRMEYSTPTVVNGGFAVAAYYHPKAIFLFGTDFGFKAGENHHADGTLYDLTEIDDELKEGVNYDNKGRWFTTGVDGSEVRTEPTMYSAKRRVEMLIGDSDYNDIKFYNCSHGAVIDGAEWLQSPEQYIDLIINDEAASSINLKDILFDPDKAIQVADSDVRIALDSCAKYLAQLAEELLDEVLPTVNTLEEVNRFVSRIYYHMIHAERYIPQSSKLLIEGSIKHFIYALYCYCHLSEPSAKYDAYYITWKQSFVSFLEEIEQHFRSIVFKEFDIDNDPWLLKAIFDAEND